MVPLALALSLAVASTGPAPDATPARDAAPEPAAVPGVAVAAVDPPAPPSARAPVATPRPEPEALSAPAALAVPVPAPAPAPRLRAMTLAPRELDRGPFRAGELAGATVGAFAGDAMVLGAGYLALQGFANGTISPTATNFRRAIYAFGIGALVVPPLTAVLMAKLTGGHGRGAFWKAMLLATAGEAAALVAGYYAAPRFWVVLPVQALTLSVGASLGLHWGPRSAGDDPPADAAREPADPSPAVAAALATPICTDAYSAVAFPGR